MLEQALAGKGIEYRVDENVVYLSKTSSPSTASASVQSAQQADTKTVTGTVVDAAGIPLIGVSVLEVGTTNGSITDLMVILR